MSQRDDLWSLLYMLMEFIGTHLPWQYVYDRHAVGNLKISIDNNELISKFPQEMSQFLTHIKELQYGQTPNYDLLRDVLNACAVKCGVNNNDPYDWELPKKPVDKESNRVDHKLSSSEKERPQLISSKDTCECLEGKGAKKKKRKAPEPADRWQGTFNGRLFGRNCPLSLGPQAMDGNYTKYPNTGEEEDCLKINVYTPSISEDSGLPVMIYIHGSEFTMPSPRDFQPDILLQREVVLVVPHYRAGPFGFLAADIDSAPGNAGLHDILLALHWVRDNIVFFGGNPGRVTLWGQSSGAGVAALMLFSPLVDPGLFQRLILQSGSPLTPWIIDEHPIQAARGIAQLTNCKRPTIENEITCLKKVPYIDILRAHSRMLMHSKLNGEAAFGAIAPVVQKTCRQPFLTAHPSELFSRGRFQKKPILAGVVAQEGSFIIGDIERYIRKDSIKVSQDFLSHNMTKVIFKIGGLLDPTGYQEQLLKDKYFSDSDLGNFTLMTKGLIDLAGTALIKSPIFTFLQEMSRSRTCYLYSFNYPGRYSKIGSGQPTDYPFSAGIAHSDDLLYLFPHKQMLFNKEEARVSRQMVDFWTSFATRGQPSSSGAPRWNKISTEKGPYLRIDNSLSERKNFLDEYRVTKEEGLAQGPFFKVI